MAAFRVLLIDDDSYWAEPFIGVLESVPPSDLAVRACDKIRVRHVTCQADANAAIREAGPAGYDLVLLDLRYPLEASGSPGGGFQGMAFLPHLRRLLPHAAIVVLTAYAHEDDLRNAVQAIRDHHANDFIPKTGERDQILTRISIACSNAYRIHQSKVLQEEFRSLLRSRVLHTFAGDVGALLDHRKSGFFQIAREVESGDPAAVAAAPDKIRSQFQSLKRAFIEQAELLHLDEVHHSRLDVADLVRRMLVFYDIRASDVGARIEGPDPDRETHVVTYESDLKIALHEVLANALDALGESGRPPGERLLAVLVEEDTDETLIRVRDNADGFPCEVIEKPFVPGTTTRSDGCHLGMGLYVAKRMLDEIGGSIELYNRPEGGGEVVLTVRSLD